MFAKTAAPPNRAATPTAPVFIGAARALLDDEWAAVATGAVVVAGGTPEVKGTPVALLAPENAGPWVEAVGFGVAVLFRGFRTLDISVLATRYFNG